MATNNNSPLSLAVYVSIASAILLVVILSQWEDAPNIAPVVPQSTIRYVDAKPKEITDPKLKKYVEQIRSVNQLLESGEYQNAKQTLNATDKSQRSFEHQLLSNLIPKKLPNRFRVDIQSEIKCLKFAMADKWLVAGCADSIVRIIDVENRKLLKELDFGLGKLLSMDVSPNGKQLVCGDKRGQISLIDLESGQLLDQDTRKNSIFDEESKSSNSHLKSVSFNSDASLVIAAHDKNKIGVWKIANGQLLLTLLKEIDTDVYNARFGETDTIYFLTAKAVHRMDMNSGESKPITNAEFRSSSQQNFPHIGLLEVFPNEKMILFQSSNSGILKSYSQFSYMEKTRFFYDIPQLNGCKPDGPVVVLPNSKDIVSSRKNELNLNKMPKDGSKSSVEIPQVLNGKVTCLALDSKNEKIAATTENNQIAVFNVPDVTNVKESERGKKFISPSGDTVTTITDQKKLSLWKSSSRELIYSSSTRRFSNIRPAINESNNMIVAVTDDNKIVVIDFANDIQLQTISDLPEAVNNLGLSPDGRVFSASFTDKTTKFWSVADGKCLLERKFSSSISGFVQFSPNGKWVAVAGDDQTVEILNTSTWESVNRLKGHIEKITRVLFRNNEQLISFSQNGIVRNWQLDSGSQSHFWSIEIGGIRTALVDPSGNRLIVNRPIHNDFGTFVRSTIEIFDIETGQSIVSIDEKSVGFNNGAMAATPSEIQKFLASRAAEQRQ